MRGNIRKLTGSRSVEFAERRPAGGCRCANGIAFGRSPGQVLDIVYLTPDQATSGGYCPHGLNGELNTSG